MTSTMNQEDFKADIQEALATLRKGGIILYPTDTIWGIGADATNPEAVARIYALKRREDSKSMLALVESVDALYRWVKCVPETALQLVCPLRERRPFLFDFPSNYVIFADVTSSEKDITSDVDL